MAKLTLTVVSGVAGVYLFGQQGEVRTLKAGQSVDIEVHDGPHADPKAAGNPGRIIDMAVEDLSAPAVGVATDEPFGNRDGVVSAHVVDGVVALRRYEGAEYVEHQLAEGERFRSDLTESNKITMAFYAGQAEPKA